MAYEMIVLTNMLIAILFAQSLNLITGFCGQVSLGHAAFLGIGAYTSAMLTKAGWPLAATFIPAMVIAGMIGMIVGAASLRVRHDFLAITTMGVSFLFTGIIRKQDMLGGEMGIAGIPAAYGGRVGLLLMTLCLTILFIIIMIYVKRSWMGYVFESIAEDEDTAGVLGIDVRRFKLFAFVLGTAGAGLAGALYAHQVRFIGPDSFGFVESVTVLSMVIVGGIGSIWGVTIAAALLSVMPQFFQVIDDYKLLVYGMLLFFAMRFMPDGLGGLAKRFRQNRNPDSSSERSQA
ncbi:MAG: branched-chain amino acid ABC transporter permease [Alphaproteobacteria bacterium]|nr:branched-chain amino acid ABC transporter permease [Alphaproteobacteria bacterium]MDG2465768.1 branched-chain amino acid ABC transporter permease [Alphaproteobacteria bacterium]